MSLIFQNKGNKLITINDNSFNPTGYEGRGMEIKYDVNGNMTEMPDKDINKIRYNYLNLSNNVNYSRSGNESVIVSMKYGADGAKLQKENTTKKVTDYLDGFQYLTTVSSSSSGGGGSESMMMANSESGRAMERQAYSFDDSSSSDRSSVLTKNQNLQFFPTAEGFYDYVKNEYIYQYKDHLGNVRISFGRDTSGNLELVDVNDYYPFGMNHLKSGNSFFGMSSYKNYKYNGKELQETGMYDYGARMHMADIGRWGVADPLAEQYRRWSPFNYAMDNPIRFIDPDGRGVNDFVRRQDGSIYWDKNANDTYSTKDGETYLGKELNIIFNSYIDEKLWDGPNSKAPGNKLTSTITLTGRENSEGELTSLVGSSSIEIGWTPIGTARDYYPGEGGSNNVFDMKTTSTGINVNFEQHASVPWQEEFAINAMGLKIVDVAQKLDINYNRNNGNLSIDSYTNIFPSATLYVQVVIAMQYDQPSFMQSHAIPPVKGIRSTPRGITAPKTDTSNYPSKFYKRN